MKKFLLRFMSYDTAERLKTALAWVYFFTGLAWLTGLARRRGAVVLMFHSVGDDRSFSDNRLPADRFEAVVAYLSRRWDIVPLSRIVDAVERGEEPSPRWVALAFDDGYADNARVALPILKKYGAVASFFPTVGVLDGTAADMPKRLFFDEIERVVLSASGSGRVPISGVATEVDLSTPSARTESAKRIILEIRTWPPAPRDAVVADVSRRLQAPPAAGRIYLTWDDVKAMEAAGMEVGSHSMTHACLATLPRPQMIDEITDSKKALDARLARPAVGFAFPFGKRYAVPANAAPDLSAAGYRYALTTDFGRISAGADRFRLPRISVEDAPLVRLKVELSGIRL